MYDFCECAPSNEHVIFCVCHSHWYTGIYSIPFHSIRFENQNNPSKIRMITNVFVGSRHEWNPQQHRCVRVCWCAFHVCACVFVFHAVLYIQYNQTNHNKRNEYTPTADSLAHTHTRLDSAENSSLNKIKPNPPNNNNNKTTNVCMESHRCNATADTYISVEGKYRYIYSRASQRWNTHTRTYRTVFVWGSDSVSPVMCTKNACVAKREYSSSLYHTHSDHVKNTKRKKKKKKWQKQKNHEPTDRKLILL